MRYFYQFCLLILLSFCVHSETYIVQSGDTLHSISEQVLGSRRFWIDIAIANNLTSPYQLESGQVIKMPENPPIKSRLSQDRDDPLNMKNLIDDVPQIVIENPDQPEIAEESPALSPQPTNIPAFKEINNPISQYLIFIGVCFLSYLISLRVGCWFALIEAGLFKCSKLIFFTFTYAIFLAGLFYAVHHFTSPHEPPYLVTKTAAGITLSVFIFALLATTRTVLECKWRSVLTLVLTTLFLGSLVAGLLGWGLYAAFPEIFQFKPIISEISAFFQNIPI